MDEAEESLATEGEKDLTYKIPFNMNELESLIDSALSDMDFGGKVESTFADFNTTLKAQESEFTWLSLRFNTFLIQINIKDIGKSVILIYYVFCAFILKRKSKGDQENIWRMRRSSSKAPGRFGCYWRKRVCNCQSLRTRQCRAILILITLPIAVKLYRKGWSAPIWLL